MHAGSSTLKSSHSGGSGTTPSPPIVNGDAPKLSHVAPVIAPQESSKDTGGDLEELSDFQFPDLSLSVRDDDLFIL